MPMLCVLIGFVIAAMGVCFKMEKGIAFRFCVFYGITLFVIASFAAFGFFCGIKGLCPYC